MPAVEVTEVGLLNNEDCQELLLSDNRYVAYAIMQLLI